MESIFSRFIRLQSAPPTYLSLPTAGIDISTSGIKIALLEERMLGLELTRFGEERFDSGTVVGGEIRNRDAVTRALRALVSRHHFEVANIALPESRGYLFETIAEGDGYDSWRLSVENRIDTFVPLPPTEVVFDIAPLSKEAEGMRVVGIGYARNVITETTHIFKECGVAVRAVESETFSLPRSLITPAEQETVLIIDIGKTTTKLLVVTNRLPRYVTTLDIGGHALTLAVQKYFGVTEEEAKKIKAERGIVSGVESEEYINAMLSTVSAIREEIVKRFLYWQSRAVQEKHIPAIERVILTGGNSTVRGLSEYLEASLKIPVILGDVFSNLASKQNWLPPIDYLESLGYGTAVGLALREYTL